MWQERYREHLTLLGRTEGTILCYLSELSPFFAYLEGCGVNLQQVTREILDGYRMELATRIYRGKPLTLKTQSRRVSALRAFFRFLTEQRYLLVDPALEFKPPKTGDDIPRTILTEEEVRCLMEVPDVNTPVGLRDRTLLEVFYGTGARNSEVRRLKLDDVDLGAKELRIHQGKGGKSRVVPLGAEGCFWMSRYLARARGQLITSQRESLVFVSSRGVPFRVATLGVVIKELGFRAGLSKRVTPHVLRHSCATHMMRRGAGIRHLQTMLGHAKACTTQLYTRVELSDLHQLMRLCHPRGRQG